MPSLRRLGACAAWLLIAACGDGEESGAGGAGGAAGDAATGGAAGGPDSGGAAGAAGRAGSAGSAGSDAASDPCTACGAVRRADACAAKRDACAADQSCAAITACVYGKKPGCPLGPGGAKCVEKCIQDHCLSDAPAKLFLEAEHCSFCAGPCTGDCTTYCEAFTVSESTVMCFLTNDGGVVIEGGATDAATE